ncbi:DUF4186 domain-containing protein [Neisseria sp. Ec49-e6-T10]|uniref:DUF4186 domain-containing protein n=1 Tax=Neisseria sp. Ec49-e6-T10 TaxID=3140744 RepID=UPI003EB6C5E3
MDLFENTLSIFDEQQLQNVYLKLQSSTFRAKFRLGIEDQRYIQQKGMGVILKHAQDFIQKRLAAANPLNDGKQTPWIGHPVFLAQHATATCCRGCLKKWHGIEKGHVLTEKEQKYILDIIHFWLNNQLVY